jgi:hypothetical protein
VERLKSATGPIVILSPQAKDLGQSTRVSPSTEILPSKDDERRQDGDPSR